MPKHPYRRGKDAPDPEHYILVRTKEGSHYRRRRGRVKPAVLNDPFQQRADGTKLSSPAAKRLRACLAETFRGLNTGRVHACFCGRLNKALLRTGRFDFLDFAGYDFQKEHPLDSLLLAAYQVSITEEQAGVVVPLDAKAVKQKSGLVSHFYFDLVLVWGDAGRDGGLRLEVTTSPLYDIRLTDHPSCELSLPLPQGGEPWMLLLKISCLEGNELAHHPRHYGMKVIWG